MAKIASYQIFYLKALLNLGDLDIRKISMNYLDLQIGVYFRTVEKFVNRAQNVLEALEKIISLTAVDSDYRTLKDVNYFLGDMGYSKCYILEDIAKAGKRGHHKFAAETAKDMLKNFSDFCAKVTAVHKVAMDKEKAFVPTAEEPVTPESYRRQLLKNVLFQVDNEETITKPKILVVDDSIADLKHAVASLSKDYNIFTVADPRKVKDFLGQVSPDLFILDLKMPEIDGFQLVPIIRSFEQHKFTPIIFLTAMGTLNYVTAALNMGVSDYIVKPVQADILRAKVKNCF